MVNAQLENRNEASQEFERGNQEASSKNVDIGISYDCAWQRRGGGKAYNSMTGVGHAFGVTTKKIVGFGVRSKTCRICAYAARKKVAPRKQSCAVDSRRSW